ncbi:hypothetical protein OA93_06475 [Flavobacterium sp. KMS]|uniref:hypothetical protein n=1 Tax=Flavobacterium sp. KMS TaxID=1566023 RepID=UPI00057DA475|nr:hypothetical protein [Flavobacterium sp. KMS]KIA99269.1 hypothetical protein OA93_06475 [Flavobacterium sp. KMS]
MLKNFIAILIANLLGLFIFVVAGLTTFNNLKHLFKNETISGKVTAVNVLNTYSKNGGATLNAFEFKMDAKKESFLTSYERLNYNISIGDSVTLKKLYVGNTNSKVLAINGQTINNFYGVFDLVMLVAFIAIILIYYIYYKMYNRKKYVNKNNQYTEALKRKKRTILKS